MAMTPVQAWEWVHTQSYPNRGVEDEVVGRFKAEFDRAVRGWEFHLVERMDALLAEVGEIDLRVQENAKALRRMQRAAENDEEIDLDEYERVHNEHSRLVQLASAMPQRLDAAVKRLEDPVASWEDTFTRFPTLPRPKFPGAGA